MCMRLESKNEREALNERMLARGCFGEARDIVSNVPSLVAMLSTLLNYVDDRYQ